MRFSLLAALLSACSLSAATDTVQTVLARMDKEAAGFHQITAKLTKTEFTEVLDNKDIESGQMRLQRKGKDVVMVVDFTQPQPRSVSVSSHNAQVFYPKLKLLDIYDLGKAGSLVDQFLVLGFGSSGKELARNYIVTYGGEETINGQKTSRLELTPKSAKVLEQIKRVQLWIPQDAGHPVQQKVLEPGGNYYLFTYSDVKLNPGLPEGAFQLQLPAGVEKRSHK